MSASQRFLLALLVIDLLTAGLLVGIAATNGSGLLWFLAGLLVMAGIWEASGVLES